VAPKPERRHNYSLVQCIYPEQKKYATAMLKVGVDSANVVTWTLG
jgi:hypothetical protein